MNRSISKRVSNWLALVSKGATLVSLCAIVSWPGTAGAGLPDAAPVAGDSSQPAKLALYAWHREWSGIAQSVIRRRDHRIRLGIASRRKPTLSTNTRSP